MNRRMVLYTIGKIANIQSVLLLLPAIVCLCYLEIKNLLVFLAVALFSFVIGLVLKQISKPRDSVIYAKEGFLIVTSTWLFMSVIGALPFVISGAIPSFIDAFFETVSGFTTTGASILSNVEALTSKGMLFWRSFTHWIGGMGVLVFILAVMPSISERSIHILRAEVPGPVVGKLVPKLKDTAKILYLIYFVLTVAEIILLICGKMPVFDSIVHSLGTAGTGGFGVKGDSLAGYSAYCQWVITAFMLIFGINFNLYYLLLLRNVRQVFKSEELWAYIGIVVVATSAIVVNIHSTFSNLEEAIRHSAFQVASIITTTGYATADFNLWPGLSKAILFVLMIIGGCAGSTAGGFKVSRIVLLFKMIKRELKKLIHPRSVSVVRFEGERAEEGVLSSVAVYLAIYCFCFLAIFLLISFEPFGTETNLSAVTACFNNVGPGFAGVGPASSYAAYSGFSKTVLSFAMLMGRLEIFPVLLFFSPNVWKRK